MIIAKNLTKTYSSDGGPVQALDGLDLTVETGGFASIMGPSGCGKSTLLNLLAGLDRPSDGSLTVEGHDLLTLSEKGLTEYRRSVVGVVFQFYNLLPTLNVRENITLPALLVGKPEAEAFQAADELAELVGISHRISHWPHQLSGGEMQRASIARALINNPPLLLADEPTGNLDSHTAEQILDLLRNISEQRGATVVMVTHSAEASAVADYVIHMVDGRVQESLEHAPTH